MNFISRQFPSEAQHVKASNKTENRPSTIGNRKHRNYAKYENLKEKMLALLNKRKYTSKEIASKLQICHPGTFFKYKALLQIDYKFRNRSLSLF
ncbi:MAG: hypothetical protein LBS60_03875 [Deltaproteobacteria bacterium]|jgi:hypothetical protein|nr:hypothetical protein [Deltaproteobacteria bacterium]